VIRDGLLLGVGGCETMQTNLDALRPGLHVKWGQCLQQYEHRLASAPCTIVATLTR